jgi:formylglycine-generating enzyme required for sulfatase activity
MARKLWVLLAVTALSGNLGCALLGGRASPVKDPAAGLELVYVKGGCFPMGNTFASGGPEEKPVHEVCLDDFYIGKFEVTQGQWTAIMGSNPSHHTGCGADCPVEMVSWNDVQEFIGRLNARSVAGGLPPGRYRLPTEAEWEYAARSGGKKERYAGRNDDIDSIAWHVLNEGATHPVGRKAPNGLGIHDMSGNVWEWTGDWYGETSYATSPRDNPTGPASGDRRVLRGGSFVNDAFDLRTSYRNYLPPDYRGFSKGFRLVRAAPARAR